MGRAAGVYGWEGDENLGEASRQSAQKRVPCVSVDVSVGPVALQLAPSHLPCVGALSHCLSAASQKNSSKNSSERSVESSAGTGRGEEMGGRNESSVSVNAMGSVHIHHSQHHTSTRSPQQTDSAGLGHGGVWGGDGLLGDGMQRAGEGTIETGGEEDENENTWGRSSLFADLLAPNYEDLVQHLLQPSSVVSECLSCSYCF